MWSLSSISEVELKVFQGEEVARGSEKIYKKVIKCIFFIYHFVEVLARLFWERKMLGAQTPHLRRNHCRPLRKAQRPPGQVSEIKEQEEFQNIKKRKGVYPTTKCNVLHFGKYHIVYNHLGVLRTVKVVIEVACISECNQGGCRV